LLSFKKDESSGLFQKSDLPEAEPQFRKRKGRDRKTPIEGGRRIDISM
jgi:hypothetical protein